MVILMAIIDKGGRLRERCQAKVLAVLEVNCLQHSHLIAPIAQEPHDKSPLFPFSFPIPTTCIHQHHLRDKSGTALSIALLTFSPYRFTFLKC